MLPSQNQAATGQGLQSHSPVQAALPVYLRLLVSNVAAGCIIGRKGTTISQLQQDSGARIHLSRNAESASAAMSSFRVVLVSGSMTACMSALQAMLDFVLNSGAPSQTLLARDGTSVVLRVIGAGGATMQDLRTTTGATITVSPLRKHPPVPPDRVVTVVGAKDAVVQAIGIMLGCLRDNDKYDLYTPQRLPDATDHGNASGSSSLPPSALIMQPFGPQYGTAVPQHLALGIGSQLAPAPAGAAYPPPVSHVAPHDGPSGALGAHGNVESMFSVPDARVGAIIGRRGEIIVKVQQLLGVRIFVSSRSEQPTADAERTVTVTGTPDAVQLAEALLQQKLRSWGPGGASTSCGDGHLPDGHF